MRIEKYTTSSISNVDDEEFYFGSDNDFWFIYDETTDDAFEFWTSDSDGAGLDAELVSIPSGGTTITVNNDLNIGNDLDVDNDLNVDGNQVLDGTLGIAANALLSGGGSDGQLILSNLAGTQGVLLDTTSDGTLELTDEAGNALILALNDNSSRVTFGNGGGSSLDKSILSFGVTNSSIGTTARSGGAATFALDIATGNQTNTGDVATGKLSLHTGNTTTDGNTGDIEIYTGVAGAGQTDAGSILFSVNGANGVGETAIKIQGSDGAIIMANLPTSDPHVVGQLWNDSTVLTVSAG